MSTRGSIIFKKGFHAWLDTNEDPMWVFFDARVNDGGGLRSPDPKDTMPQAVCLTHDELDILALGWIRYRMALPKEDSVD